MADFKRKIVEVKVKRYGEFCSPRAIVKFECGHVYRFHKNQYMVVGNKINCPDCRQLAGASNG